MKSQPGSSMKSQPKLGFYDGHHRRAGLHDRRCAAVSLSSKLATAATASAALGVTVEAVPTVAIASPADPDGDPAGTKDDDAGLSLAAIGGIVGGGGALLLLLAAAGGAVWYRRCVLQLRELPVMHTIELACPLAIINSEPGDKEGGGPASPSARQARAL